MNPCTSQLYGENTWTSTLRALQTFRGGAFRALRHWMQRGSWPLAQGWEQCNTRWSPSLCSLEGFWEMLPLLLNSGKFQDHLSSSALQIHYPGWEIPSGRTSEEWCQAQVLLFNTPPNTRGGSLQKKFYLQVNSHFPNIICHVLLAIFLAALNLFTTRCIVYPFWSSQGNSHTFPNFTCSALGFCSTSSLQKTILLACTSKEG